MEEQVTQKIAHNVKVSVFCKEGEDEKELKISMLSLLPYEGEELTKQKVAVHEEVAKLDLGRQMKIFSFEFTKNKHVNDFLNHLKEILGDEQKQILLDNLETHVDENSNFYFRLDKNKFNLGECEFTNTGDCFHFKINIAAFPARQKLAMEMVKNWLNS